MQEKNGIHCFVTGRVQGVFFRASTQDKAKELGLVGWAKNLEDGKVEVIAFGNKEKLLELYEWLKIGPENANVTDLTFKEIPFEEHQRFAVK